MVQRETGNSTSRTSETGQKRKFGDIWPRPASIESRFTLQRLNLPESLHKYLATTNIIESPQGGVERRTHNVTRWLRPPLGTGRDPQTRHVKNSALEGESSVR